MQISGPNRVKETRGARARTRGGAPGETFRVDTGMGTAAATGAQGASAASTVVSVDALLALQGGEDRTERHRRAVAHGTMLLDLLEDIKIDLLAGGLSPGRLRALLDAVSREQEGVEDTRLEALLGEIDLRARVELAKHRHFI